MGLYEVLSAIKIGMHFGILVHPPDSMATPWQQEEEGIISDDTVVLKFGIRAPTYHLKSCQLAM